MYFYVSEPAPGMARQVVVGKDKFENDMLIKYGYRELNYMWFHADKYSSGHVYLKMNTEEKGLEDVPSEVVNDCLQLCKSESIQGNKLPQCTILYTPWHNLRKNRYMKPGEVSFKSLKYCKRKECFARDNKVLNRLTKTRVEVIDNVESFLHEAKKSKDPMFFINYIEQNREELLAAEKARKVEKKMAKKKKLSEDEFYTD
ncbi:Protein JLP2 [Nakaseomyces bracarensis]|uniref:Protein JLP2 n=1 Tax=Nakaseomyces bracarensis TaxID=273131 RepID=A0ABR4NV23_9SACH